jgi:hypothetical protein
MLAPVTARLAGLANASGPSVNLMTEFVRARRTAPHGATLKEFAKSYNVGRTTISRLAT